MQEEGGASRSLPYFSLLFSRSSVQPTENRYHPHPNSGVFAPFVPPPKEHKLSKNLAEILSSLGLNFCPFEVSISTYILKALS